MEYYRSIEANKSAYLGESTEYEMFAVSQSNYRQILRSKSLNGYREFFNENYF